MNASPTYGQTFDNFAGSSFSWAAIELPAWTKLFRELFPSVGYDDPIYANHTCMPPHVLDLGCGGGRMMIPISNTIYQMRDHSLFTGLDISGYMIETSKIRWPNARFIEGDVRDLSRLGWQGEMVVSHMLFHLLSDNVLENLIRRVSKCLNPGGVFAFCIPHQERINRRVKTNRSSVQVATPWGAREGCHPRSAADYQLLLKRYKFVDFDSSDLVVIDEFKDELDAQYHTDGPSRLLVLARKA